MAKQKNWKTFSIRIPPALLEQVDARAKMQYHSRNTEILNLIERAINASVNSDLAAIRKDQTTG